MILVRVKLLTVYARWAQGRKVFLPSLPLLRPSVSASSLRFPLSQPFLHAPYRLSVPLFRPSLPFILERGGEEEPVRKWSNKWSRDGSFMI